MWLREVRVFCNQNDSRLAERTRSWPSGFGLPHLQGPARVRGRDIPTLLATRQSKFAFSSLNSPVIGTLWPVPLEEPAGGYVWARPSPTGLAQTRRTVRKCQLPKLASPPRERRRSCHQSFSRFTFECPAQAGCYSCYRV